MDKQPSPSYPYTEPELSSVAEPEVAYPRSAPTSVPIGYYGGPPPRTKEEMDRWVKEVDEDLAAGRFCTADEMFAELQYIIDNEV